MNPEVSEPKRVPKRGIMKCLGAATSVAVASSLMFSGPAFADQFNELTMDWTGNTNQTSISNGGNAAVEVRINSNDTEGASGVQENTTVNLTATNGVFRSLPAVCLEDAVSPVSAISADGKSLTCNVGKVEYGTAKFIEAGLRASGNNGDEVNVTASMDGVEPVSNNPIPIRASAGIEVVANGTTNRSYNKSTPAAITRHQMGIAIPTGGELLQGPVEIEFQIIDQVGKSAIENLEITGCKTGGNPTGNSGGSPNVPSMNVGDCVLERIAPDRVKMTLTNYLDNFSGPTVAANGEDVPTDLSFLGAYTMEFSTPEPFSAGGRYGYDLVVDKISATTTSGARITADTNLENNRSSAILIDVGRWASNWDRTSRPAYEALGIPNDLAGQGSTYDANGQLLPGEIGYTIAGQGTYNEIPSENIEAGTTDGFCTVIDNRYVTYKGAIMESQLVGVTDNSFIDWDYLVGTSSDAFIENTTEGNGCATGNWVDNKPADASTIMGVKATYDPKALVAWAEQNEGLSHRSAENMLVAWEVKSTTPHQQPLWMSSGIYGEGSWGTEWQYGNMDGTGFHDVPNAPDQYGMSRTQAGIDAVYAINVKATSGTFIEPTETGLKEPFNVEVKGSLTAGNSTVVDSGKMRVQTVLPSNKVQLVEGSFDVEPVSVVVNDNGSTTITWEHDVRMNQEYTYNFDVQLVEGARVHNINSTTTNISDTTTGGSADVATSRDSIRVLSDGATYIEKQAGAEQFAVDSANSWTITLQNRDSVTQETTDIIDVLPYNGDGRGTKMNGTANIGDVTSTHEGTVYYTSADPSTLNSDPDHASNGGFGEPSDLWTTEKPSTVTGIRVIGKALGFGETQIVEIPYTTSGAQENDVLSNIAQGRATHTELRMIKADTTSVLPSALQINKEFVDQGSELLPGGKLVYDLTVRNSGEGAASRVIVKDKGGKNILPGSIAPVNLPDGDTFNAETATWAIAGLIQPGETRTLRVEATIVDDPDGTTIVNSATVENPTNPPGEECIPNETVEADTDQCDVVEIDVNNLLKIDKKLDTAAGDIVPEGEVEYTITGMNAGTSTADAVKITDVPVEGLVEDSIVISNPSKGEIVEGVWNVGSLEPGEKVTANVTGKLQADVNLAETGFVNATAIENPWHPVPGPAAEGKPNDTVEQDDDQRDIVEFTLKDELKIDKRLVTEMIDILPGEEIEYEVTGLNVGPDASHNVIIKDIPLDGLEEDIAFGEPSKGQIVEIKDDNEEVVGYEWHIDVLEAGEKVTVPVNALVSEDADISAGIVNATSIENPWHPVGPIEETVPNDTVEEDDDQRDKVEVKQEHMLQIAKNLESPIEDVVPGGELSYKVTVQNAGPDTAHHVMVNDFPGVGLDPESIVLSDPSMGEIMEDGTWYIETLTAKPAEAEQPVEEPSEAPESEEPAEEPTEEAPVEEVPAEEITHLATITVTVKVAEDASVDEGIVNSAVVENPWNPFDPEGECVPNNEDVNLDEDQCDTVETKVSDKVQIDKAPVDGVSWLPGEQAEYTITVKNPSDFPAANVVVTDTPVTSLSEVQLVDPSQGEISEEDALVWNVGTLEPGQTASISVVGIVTGSLDTAGTIVNKASVENPWNPFDPEGECVPNDGVDADEDQCDSVTVEWPNPPVVPIDPENPADPDDPNTPKPIIDSGLGAGDNGGMFGFIFLGLLLLAGAGGYLVWRRKRNAAEDIAS